MSTMEFPWRGAIRHTMLPSRATFTRAPTLAPLLLLLAAVLVLIVVVVVFLPPRTDFPRTKV